MPAETCDDGGSISFKWTLASLIIWRRCRLPFRTLEDLVPRQTWRILERIQTARATRYQLGKELSNFLYKVVPSSPSHHRRELIAFRRHLYNDRLPNQKGVSIVQRYLPKSRCRSLECWLNSRKQEKDLLKAASDLLRKEMESARRTFAMLVLDQDFTRGIQQSKKRRHYFHLTNRRR